MRLSHQTAHRQAWQVFAIHLDLDKWFRTVLDLGLFVGTLSHKVTDRHAKTLALPFQSRLWRGCGADIDTFGCWHSVSFWCRIDVQWGLRWVSSVNTAKLST